MAYFCHMAGTVYIRLCRSLRPSDHSRDIFSRRLATALRSRSGKASMVPVSAGIVKAVKLPLVTAKPSSGNLQQNLRHRHRLRPLLPTDDGLKASSLADFSHAESDSWSCCANSCRLLMHVFRYQRCRRPPDCGNRQGLHHRQVRQ